MRPILPSRVELPDEDWVEVVGIVRNSSNSEAPHIHLFPKPGKKGPNSCIRMESQPIQVDGRECADFRHTVDSSVAQLEGAPKPNPPDEDISPIFENDMTESVYTISPNYTVDERIVRGSSPSAYLNCSRPSTSHFQNIRMTANIIHKTPSNAHLPIVRHLLGVLAGNDSTTLVADSENIYKDLIRRLTPLRIEKDLLAALDPDIAKVYQIGSLDFDTLRSLDHSKAESYHWPGVYLHVVHDEEHAGIFWLYVGAAMNVSIRIAQHYKFRYSPSRSCLHYHAWNLPGRKDFFVLLGGFHGMSYDVVDQSAMNNLFEEWSCLIWQTLPSPVLSTALPRDFRICEANIHLNRASPLRQKYNCKGITEGNIETAIELRLGSKSLLLSHDPDIRAYFERQEDFYNLPMWRKLEGLRLGRTIQEQTHFKDITLMHRKRQTFDNSSLVRDPNPEKGDVTEVWIQCSICKHPKTMRLDPAPLYDQTTGLYVRRRLACRICPRLTGKYGRWDGSRENCPTEPVDSNIRSISKAAVYNNWSRSQKAPRTTTQMKNA